MTGRNRYLSTPHVKEMQVGMESDLVMVTEGGVFFFFQI